MDDLIIHFERPTSESKTAFRAFDSRTNQQYVARQITKEECEHLQKLHGRINKLRSLHGVQYIGLCTCDYKKYLI